MRVIKLDNFTKSQKPWEVEEVEWKEVRLGEVCIINPKKSEVRRLLSQNVEVSFIPMEYVDDVEGRIVKTDIRPIQTVYKGYTYFKEGEVLFAKITPCMENGKSAVAQNLKNGIGFGSTEFHVLRPTKDILPEFIFYFIRRKRFRNLAKLHFTGNVGHKRVPKEFLINTKLPLPFRNGKPDLETQKKIVEYIEANFSRIDSILEKKKNILYQLDELWESTLENAFKPREGEEWREVKLREIIVDKPRYGLTAKSKNKGKHLYLRITDINDKGEINQDGFKFVDLDEKEKSKYEIKKGDLLLARSGSVGNFFIADKDYPEWVYASYLIRFRLDSTKILPSFIKHILTSGRFKRWVEYQKRTGAQPNINAKEYSSFKLPLPFRNGKPDLERQKEIADYLDKVYKKINSIKEKVKSQISQLDEMKESILNEVFSHDKVK